MAGPITISVVGDVRDLVGATGTAKRELGGLNKVAGTAGRAVKAGLFVAGAAAVAFGAKSVKASSDAQQSLGATETVFKRYADTVVDRSNEAATAVGLSANEYRELNNVLGASLKAAGTPLRDVADLTDNLTNKAADLAATYGGTTREAIESVSSLLRGEADPIERYGVSIKQSDVNARLAAQGLDKLTGSALKTADQQARLKLLFDQTKDSVGAFRREGDTAAHQQQVFAAQVENVEAKVGDLLLPALTKLGKWANEDGVPALEDLVDWVTANKDEIGDFAGTVTDSVLPPLKALGGLVGDVAGFLGDLPGPAQRVGIELGIAALAIAKLNSALAGTAFPGFISNLTNAETRTAALGKAARLAAGTAGILALAEATQQTNPKLKALETVAGAAATGFAVGGPWGAAAGTLLGVGKATNDVVGKQRELRDAADDAASNMAGLSGHVADYREELEATSGAIDELVRKEALRAAQADGILSITTKLDVAQRDLIGATLGNEGATRRLNSAFDENFTKLTALEQVKLSQWLRDNTHGFAQQQAQARENAKATTTWHKALKGLPPKVRTEVKALGAEASAKEIRQLKKQYDLSPKRVRTIIEALGTDATIKKVKGVWTVLEGGKKVKPGLDGWTSELVGTVTRGKDKTNRGVTDINRMFGDVGKKKPALAGLTSGVADGINQALGIARANAPGVGVSLGSGIESGLRGTIGNIAAAARQAVATAIAAARHEADAHSPSRKTKRLGKDLTDGLIAGLRGGSAGVKRAIADVVGDAAKAWNKHHKENFTKAQRAGLAKAFADERKDLTKLAGRYRTVTNEIAAATGKLKNLREEAKSYAAGVAAAARATATIGDLGKLEDGTQTAAGIRAGLEDRLAALRNFQAKVKTLIGLGLKGDALRQLIDEGVDAGTITAEALLTGGKAAVADVVDLTKEIGLAAGDLGELASSTLYDAGIQGQAALLKGLERDKARLERTAGNIADRLIRTIRQRLNLNLGGNGGGGNGGGNGGRHRTALDKDLATTGRRTRVNDRAGRGTVTVRLTAEQRTQLERGRELRLDLDAWDSAGGRTRA